MLHSQYLSVQGKAGNASDRSQPNQLLSLLSSKYSISHSCSHRHAAFTTSEADEYLPLAIVDWINSSSSGVKDILMVRFFDDCGKSQLNYILVKA